MTFNSIAYLIFLMVICYITFRVGWVFYKNGEVYLRIMLKSEEHLVQAINKILLVGYYLVNIGYAAWTLKGWEPIFSGVEMLEVLARRSGFIVIMLAVMHYINLAWIMVYARAIQQKVLKQ